VGCQRSGPAAGSRTRRQIESPSNDVFVSAATGWEIAVKSKLGRLTLPDDPQRFVRDQMDETLSRRYRCS